VTSATAGSGRGPAEPLRTWQRRDQSMTLDYDVSEGRFAVPNPRPTLHPAPEYRDAAGGAAALEWRRAVDGDKRYPHVNIDRSVRITMSDGVRLRATVVRPANRFGQPVRTPLPAILNVNPYNRAML